jgi:hypothetical protein
MKERGKKKKEGDFAPLLNAPLEMGEISVQNPPYQR